MACRFIALIVVLLAAVAAGVAFGPVWIDPFRFFSNRLLPSEKVILLSIRLPRVLGAALVGGCLSTSGLIFQSVLENPLADPFILGVSGGAAVGAVAGLCLFGTPAGTTTMMAFLGGVFALLLVFSIVRLSRLRLIPETLILSGIAISFLTTACVTLILYLADDLTGQKVLYWIMGNLGQFSYGLVAVIAVALAIVAGFVYFRSKELDLMAYGEEMAASSGVVVARERIILLFLGALIAALSVACCGVVGFVGLMAPHFSRLLFSNRHRLLVPAALMIGSSLLVSADLFSRIILSPRELPVGVVMAFLGVPFFLFLLRSKRLHE